MPRTIFGTTEKSNFILNMRPQTVQKWLHGVLLYCLIFPQVGAIFITFLKKDIFEQRAMGVEGLVITTYWFSFFLLATGFVGVLFYLIPMLRGDLKFFDNSSYTVIIIIALLSFASYYGVILRKEPDYYLTTALLGTEGRYEGFLSLLAYFGIFLVETCVSQKKTVRSVLDVLVVLGILQSIFAILQHIPGLGFPSDFNNLLYSSTANVMLSSGLADSPVFYGSFVTLVSGVAVIGAIYDKSIIRARIYAAAAVLLLITGLFTSSIVPIIGIGAGLVIVTVIVAVNRAKGVEITFKGGLLITPELRYAVLLGTLAGVFALVYLIQGIYIRDKDIAYSDGFFRLAIIQGPSFRQGYLDDMSLYEIAWGRSVDFIKQHPLTGTGPDCFITAQLETNDLNIWADSIDKSYNEYLYIAVTRGIPSLIAYFALIWVALRKTSLNMKEFFQNSENWYIPALFTAVTAYLLQGFFGVSAITVAPFFWLLLGFMCSKRIED